MVLPRVIAAQALERIGALYAVEKDIRGRNPVEPRAARQEKCRAVVETLEPWLREKLALISQKTKLAEAIRYALSRWDGLKQFIDYGRIQIDTLPENSAYFGGRSYVDSVALSC